MIHNKMMDAWVCQVGVYGFYYYGSKNQLVPKYCGWDTSIKDENLRLSGDKPGADV